MDASEIAWFSSAFAFACFVYSLEASEPPGGPKESLIPINVNGKIIHVPPAFADAISDLPKFVTKFELALKKAVPGLKSSSGTLWTTRMVRDKKPELEKALQGMDWCVPLFLGVYEVLTFDFIASDVTTLPCSTEPSTLMIAVRRLKKISRTSARNSWRR
jgi:hypothetical protein